MGQSSGACVIIAAGIGAAGLSLALHLAFLRPWLRTRKLKAPCEVRFVIRELGHAQLPYVVKDHQTHILDELVLPSHATVDIELSGYKPRVAIQLEQLVFGCEGDAAAKPFVTAAFDRFTSGEQERPAPGDHSKDIHKLWHTVRKAARSVGTHDVITYRLQTREAGVYPVAIAFLTNEIEGNARLTIRVEDNPKTVCVVGQMDINLGVPSGHPLSSPQRGRRPSSTPGNSSSCAVRSKRRGPSWLTICS